MANTVKVARSSRLRLGSLLSQDGGMFWDMLQLDAIPSQPDDILHTVSAEERIDLLAYDFYGDPGFWWVIALANEMELLPFDLTAGATIRIPSPAWVRQRFLSKGS